MIRRLAAGALLAVVAGVTAPAAKRATPTQAPPALPPITLAPTPLVPALRATVDPVLNAVWSRFDRRAALGHVTFVSQYWRLAGNAGYDATLARIHDRLVASGFANRPATASVGGPATWVEAYPNAGKGWAYTVGTLALEHGSGPEEVLLSRTTTNLAVCINSFSTPAGGLVAPIVDVGAGATDAAFAGRPVRDAIVLGDADPAELWRRAMALGARGVISTSLGAYVNPDPPGTTVTTPRDRWNILQWGTIPYDEARKGFAFKATPHAASALRRAIAQNGQAEVRATVASTFSTAPNRMLVAEIPGRLAPAERIVMTAHVQEPGANDNASGVATLAELARALRLAIGAGAIRPPDRTLTFLWLEEISGSREWLTDHADDAKQVRYMFSMDMTGEDTRKTGGTFLIERFPDPGAVWDRPWDPHTEWGRGDVRADTLRGDLLNDLHLAICGRVAEKTGWVVRTNPYEGGSDHTVFGAAGIPAVLDWHFTDRYYHTNLDTADKTSPSEMRNVGTAVATSAWLLASTSETNALAVATLVARAGTTRLAIEEREGARLAAAEANRSGQDAIVAAWKKWYAEAVRSAVRLVDAPTATLRAELNTLAAPFAGSK